MSLPLRLPFPFLLALRYLHSVRRDAFINFLSSVTAGGIAVGVAALILALAALSGFQHKLVAEVMAQTPQIEVELPPQADPRRLAAAASQVAGVASAQAVIHGRGWLLGPGRPPLPVALVGFDHTLPAWFPGAAGQPPTGLYLRDTLALRLGLEPGDSLQLASARPTLTPFGPQPRTRRVRLAATFKSGWLEQDEERVALPLPIAESLLGPLDRRLDVTLEPGAEAPLVAGRLAAALPPGVTVRTGRDLNLPLFFALRLEKSLVFVAVFLIVAVASLALVASLAVILTSKHSEIGILAAMGASPPTLRRAFVALGTLLAGLGTGAGTCLGLLASWVLDRYRLISLPGDVYILDYVPFLVRPVDLAIVLVATFGLTLVSSFSAARKAAAKSPVEALRG